MAEIPKGGGAMRFLREARVAHAPARGCACGCVSHLSVPVRARETSCWPKILQP